MPPHFINKNRILIFIACGLICVLIFKWQGSRKTLNEDLSAPIKKGSIIETVYGIGTVTANQTFQFKTGMINTINELYVKEGDIVKKEDPLIALQNGLIIKAPFDGTVTTLPFKVGENIFPEKIAVEVVNLLDRYLVVSLEQRGALRVRKGQIAKLSFDGLREETFEGVVDSIYSSENDFLIRIAIPDLPSQILPGMTADTAIGINEHHDVLLIPVSAIDGDQVYVYQNSGRKEVNVKTGIIDGAMAEVVEGDIKEGDRLFILKTVKK